MKEQELEVKLFLKNLSAVEARLKSLGASQVQARLHEHNLRFDTPDAALTRNKCVLRLRQDAGAYITYKGPALPGQEVAIRQEIEFAVSDYSAARKVLESIGFSISVIYEKYRTTYELDNVKITLDEMPFGDFVEIEGPDASAIHAMTQKLGLNWAARCTESYLEIFGRLKRTKGLTFRDLTFVNFHNLPVSAEELNLQYAD